MATLTVTILANQDSAVAVHTIGHTDYAIIPIPQSLTEKFLVTAKATNSFLLQVNDTNYTDARSFTCVIIEHPTLITVTISAGTDTSPATHTIGHTNYRVIPDPQALDDAFIVTDIAADGFTLTTNNTDFDNDRTFNCLILENQTIHSAVVEAETDTATVTYAYATTAYQVIPIPQALDNQFITTRASTNFVLTINPIDYDNQRTFECIILFGGEYMSTATEGLYGNLTVGGTTIALLSEVTLNHTREAKEWVPMGSVATTDVLLGPNVYKVTAKRAFVDNTYANYITGGSVLAGTLYPVGGTAITAYGSLICTSRDVTGIRQASADPVMEDLSFIFFNVTHA